MVSGGACDPPAPLRAEMFPAAVLLPTACGEARLEVGVVLRALRAPTVFPTTWSCL